MHMSVIIKPSLVYSPSDAFSYVFLSQSFCFLCVIFNIIIYVSPFIVEKALFMSVTNVFHVRHHYPWNQHVNRCGTKQDSSRRESPGDQNAEGRLHSDKPGQDICRQDNAENNCFIHCFVVNVIVVSGNSC